MASNPQPLALALAIQVLVCTPLALGGMFDSIPKGVPDSIPDVGGDIDDLGDLGDLDGMDDSGAGGSCDDADDCTTGNCQNGVCCIKGKACCTSNAECDEGLVCDKDRFYCVAEAGEDQVTREDVQKEIDAAAGLVATAEVKGADASVANSTIEKARGELSAGNTANAFKLAMEAKTEAEKVVASIKKGAGETCTTGTECETNNCNGVCCMAGNVCCTNDAQCKQGESCETERFFCMGPEESGERPKGFMNTLIFYREVIETLFFIVAALGAAALFLARRSGVIKEPPPGAGHPSTLSEYGGYYAATYNYGYAQEASPYPQPAAPAQPAPTAPQQAPPATEAVPAPSPYGAPAAPAAAPEAPPAPQSVTYACPACGAAFEAGAAQCPGCGYRLAQ